MRAISPFYRRHPNHLERICAVSRPNWRRRRPQRSPRVSRLIPDLSHRRIFCKTGNRSLDWVRSRCCPRSLLRSDWSSTSASHTTSKHLLCGSGSPGYSTPMSEPVWGGSHSACLRGGPDPPLCGPPLHRFRHRRGQNLGNTSIDQGPSKLHQSYLEYLSGPGE